MVSALVELCDVGGKRPGVGGSRVECCSSGGERKGGGDQAQQKRQNVLKALVRSFFFFLMQVSRCACEWGGGHMLWCLLVWCTQH